MSLAKAQIRAAIVTALKGSMTTPAGLRVFASRAWALSMSQLPAWRVMTQQERVRPVTVHWPPKQEHTLVVDLQGVCRDVDDVDADLDAMELAALQALFGAQGAVSVSGKALQVELLQTDREHASEGEAATAEVVLSLQITYHTLANNPETIV